MPTKKKVTKKKARKKIVRKQMNDNVTFRFMLALVNSGAIEELPDNIPDMRVLAADVRRMAEQLNRQATRKSDVDPKIGGGD